MAKIEEKQSKQKIEITDGVLIPARDDSSIFSAWRISFYGAIAALIMLPFLSPEPYSHVLKFIIGFDESWHFDIGNSGLVKTFEVTVLSIFFALFIGLLVGLGRISRISF
ncbi:MAG TPA: hypothetical protein P5566_12030, partial [Spirochaetota bacterium]|nr:hypothetical protein [Spirochaetota bacterium]